ncbi:STAS domain-containing protein [Thioalkalivibrio sp. AKL12]|uniref:STAS domain-containing protein n=1 Tax=Thioalkalivibrio sp. AKL12 TaxID=1158159 RepID=UPI000377651C|nr:STAS domain-containing protein [Thioalkalivibrio sp. AKL12]
MELNKETVDGVCVVSPEGRLDSNTSPAFEAELLALLDDSPTLVIRFADLEYISSAGLRVMLMAAKKVRQLNGQLVLCEIHEPIREVFEISGFLSILDVCDDRAVAVARARGEA